MPRCLSARFYTQVAGICIQQDVLYSVNLQLRITERIQFALHTKNAIPCWPYDSHQNRSN
jgi:hypothetical protein